jgi:nitroimidazol reductase NimA-like FMN-containing flavoprotein (pyridoxamine 5'-phosphate oxidase superfamily)
MLADVARTVIDTNRYMTLATADADGAPWASPVFYAHSGYREFYWISAPETRHSRNLGARPEVAIVVFDSTGAIGTVDPVFLDGTAQQVSEPELLAGLAVYPGAKDPAARALTMADVQAPSPYRMYRAVITEHFMLCPRDREPCAIHGRAYDHRVAVEL